MRSLGFGLIAAAALTVFGAMPAGAAAPQSVLPALQLLGGSQNSVEQAHYRRRHCRIVRRCNRRGYCRLVRRCHRHW